MTAWPTKELEGIAGKDDLHIAPLREDGKTYGTPLGSGRSWWTARSMCAPTTGQIHAGTRPRCGRRRDG